MKTTITKLRRIIRKTIKETYNPKGYGWHDLKMMASEGNYEGCTDWIEGMLQQLGVNPSAFDNEQIYGLIEYASDETVTEEELQKEFNELVVRLPLAPEFRRFGSVSNFIQTVVWPCYQEGDSAEDCVNKLGTQEMQFLRRYRNVIALVNDNPEFIGFALEVADMLRQDY